MMEHSVKSNGKSSDDYMTPKSAWEDVAPIIRKTCEAFELAQGRPPTLWEGFYGNGASGEYLHELTNLEVVHQNEDFFENDRGDIFVSNPPFSQTEKVLKRLKTLGKPFLLLLPSSRLNAGYFQDLFAGDKRLQIIIPPKRINFDRLIDGSIVRTKSNAANFDCFYYCWNMELEHDITYIQRKAMVRNGKRKMTATESPSVQKLKVDL